MCEGDQEPSDYKTSNLRAIRAALIRYFKAERGIDIRTNQHFIQSNEMFLAVTKVSKKKESKPPIHDTDMKKVEEYFRQQMRHPNPTAPPRNLHLLHNLLSMSSRP